MKNQHVNIQPGIGWADLQPGDTIDQVRETLSKHGYCVDPSEDEFVLDILEPQITFYFDDSNPKRLTQIVFYDHHHQVDEQPVIGLPLAEALLPFQVRSYEDAMWSLVSIEEEFPKGKPLPDSKRIRKAKTEEKLNFGTLWIKSQGVGLVMHYGVVQAIALRRIGSTPTIGCGSLDSSMMKLALEEPSQQVLDSKNASNREKSVSHAPAPSKLDAKGESLGQRAVWMLLALAVLALPAFIIYRDYTAWNNAKPVIAKVVSTEPEGPFPERIIVEYSLPDIGEFRVTIPDTFTRAREIGEEVELLYLPDHPERALTRLQARGEKFSISPILLVGSITVSIFFSLMAFGSNTVRRRRVIKFLV